MILFLGTRLGKKTIRQLNNYSCEYCSQKDTIQVISQPNYFHLFWLPLFKIKTVSYAECSHCKRFYYEEEFSNEMKKVRL